MVSLSSKGPLSLENVIGLVLGGCYCEVGESLGDRARGEVAKCLGMCPGM